MRKCRTEKQGEEVASPGVGGCLGRKGFLVPLAKNKTVNGLRRHTLVPQALAGTNHCQWEGGWPSLSSQPPRWERADLSGEPGSLGRHEGFPLPPRSGEPAQPNLVRWGVGAPPWRGLVATSHPEIMRAWRAQSHLIPLRPRSTGRLSLPHALWRGGPAGWGDGRDSA